MQYFTKKYNKIDLDYLKNYFINSSFHDGTKLYISITNSEFNKSELNFKINFTKEIDFSIINDPINKHLKIDDNYLYLKIRKEAFLSTIYNKRSWEDISIGFQNRQFRKPNIYNSNFWFHFSNRYVSKKHVKSQSDCSNCISLNQDIHNVIFNNSE